MPTAQRPMNSASSLGFTALRSMIRDGRDKVVTAIIKERTVPSCAPLESSASATGMVPKNICVHGDTNDRSEDHAKRIVAAEYGFNPTFRYPVVDQRADPDTNQNIGEHFLEGASICSFA